MNGRMQALGWAWEKRLPAQQKLVLLYLASYVLPKPHSTTAIAHWGGLPLHAPARILRALRKRGLIEFEDSTRIVHLRLDR